MCVCSRECILLVLHSFELVNNYWFVSYRTYVLCYHSFSHRRPPPVPALNDVKKIKNRTISLNKIDDGWCLQSNQYTQSIAKLKEIEPEILRQVKFAKE